MKFLLAIDSFKGSISSIDAANSFERGLRRVRKGYRSNKDTYSRWWRRYCRSIS
ncbi:hypothetical protein [Caloramator sp. mosi_1]|uniref:hypothetical protein n=1 Tax=Caloramator sp. mosi_1 TaxID=3023090 RepID=UPI003081F09E